MPAQELWGLNEAIASADLDRVAAKFPRLVD
jgi:hypothetical protein